MQENYSDKDFFKDMKKMGNEYSEDFTESFPYCCLKIVWSDLSADDIEDALQGLMTNDEGIDAFYIDEDAKEINIIQCKSCISEKNRKAVKKDWLSLLATVPKKLEDHDFIDTHPNSRIKEIAEQYIKYKRIRFKPKLHFFHLGHASPNALQPFEKNIEYYDWEKIKDGYQEYRSRLDRTEPSKIEITLNYDYIQPNNISDKHKTFISIMTGDEIVTLREQHRYKLFDKNLRFGLGKNKINKGIMQTAQNHAGNFYFYNNGITITSQNFKYKPTNNKLTIESPQIINGAQTVNAIYEAYKERKNQIARTQPEKDATEVTKKEFAKINLLFRVIQDSEKDGKKTSNFEENVIRYNNSQTLIKEADFYANRPEQIKLQELFAKFGYFYEIKRGDREYLKSGKAIHNLLNKQKKDFKHWDEKITIEKLASLWMAYYVEPNLNTVRKQNIFGFGKDKNYEAVFKEVDKITDDYIKEMILAYNLFDCIAKQADIYSSSSKKGQIMTKLNKITNSNGDKDFSNAKKMIQESFLFSDIVKNDFKSKKVFLEKKDKATEMVRKYHFFSMGKYMVLAIFKMILKECKYEKTLLSSKLFHDKEFIKEKLVKAWLKTILDELLIKEYEKFEHEHPGLSKQKHEFHRRKEIWDNITKEFKNLDYKKEKEFTDIFPLDMSTKQQ